jgi:hypothetical protein
VSPARRSDAERTEVALQEGVRSGRPVMIPGAFEARVGRPVASPPAGAARVWPRTPRSAVPRRSFFERLWRYVMRPTDTPPM